jgi:hypothetical protein
LWGSQSWLQPAFSRRSPPRDSSVSVARDVPEGIIFRWRRPISTKSILRINSYNWTTPCAYRHTVITAEARGWDRLTNGALLKVAEETWPVRPNGHVYVCILSALPPCVRGHTGQLYRNFHTFRLSPPPSSSAAQSAAAMSFFVFLPRPCSTQAQASATSNVSIARMNGL